MEAHISGIILLLFEEWEISVRLCLCQWFVDTAVSETQRGLIDYRIRTGLTIKLFVLLAVLPDFLPCP